MTTTITLAGAILLIAAVVYTIISYYDKNEERADKCSISADVYFASFILLVGLYSSRPKVINNIPTQKDTVVVRDTIFTHAPSGTDIISGIHIQHKTK